MYNYGLSEISHVKYLGGVEYCTDCKYYPELDPLLYGKCFTLYMMNACMTKLYHVL